jgi:hypothetical protein
MTLFLNSNEIGCRKPYDGQDSDSKPDNRSAVYLFFSTALEGIRRFRLEWTEVLSAINGADLEKNGMARWTRMAKRIGWKRETESTKLKMDDFSSRL